MASYTAEEFWLAVDWEGGIVELLTYGVAAEDIKDPTISKLWAELATAWSAPGGVGEIIENLQATDPR